MGTTIVVYLIVELQEKVINKKIPYKQTVNNRSIARIESVWENGCTINA